MTENSVECIHIQCNLYVAKSSIQLKHVLTIYSNSHWWLATINQHTAITEQHKQFTHMNTPLTLVIVGHSL